MPPLAGVVVVVTRPAAQAERFAALAAAAGARPLLLPAIEITPLELDARARAQLAPDAYDWTIYTSANAVDCSLRQLPRPERSQVAAVGRGTARVLQERGIEVAALPRTTADSEGLLALECFADLRGRRVLILKGRRGRTLLREELARRGAEVVLGDLYERRPASVGEHTLRELREACDAQTVAVAATSTEVLDALLALVPESGCPRLRDMPLVVPGERVAAAARARGWRGRLVVAPSAEDEAMLDAMVHALGGGGHTNRA